ncbi:glutamate-5-semialdehyde dehydrogenase [Draconibacterium orientale]|jgi:glutamate-5-semialdehyde dehydrogenase|uniref:Gamma-glutamyl phosphate reductase n=1 Tax=Draconibacterium orientale TaxID=1168034 RepID=X5DHA2_9BACT|nr:glutamate-5-semialdehyde dehydrogenase [Draconibacterium orientale]AHW59827.1 gamma-glutamyl phosphate reductase [Draconibacterium orientale]SET18452.1 glutamate-5-semialdehyde dehydrogenase [Draconibacterium orientale]
MKIEQQLKKTLEASRKLNLVNDDQVKHLLLELANEARTQSEIILAENQKDLDRMDPQDPKFDRLKLSEERIEGIASDMENVARLESPVGKTLKETVRENGLKIKKVTVPFGVIGIIYEARPNVTFDVFALCLKSGNACVLKGGSDAIYSNQAIVSIIRNVLKKFGFDENTVTLLPAGREETNEMLRAHGYIDLIIPRGSQGLINFVRENATIPVIETGAGICHTYFDEFGDAEKGREIIFNAKTRRPSVCNALDCLLIHESRLNELNNFAKKLSEEQVVIYADEKAYQQIKQVYPAELLFEATEESFGTEFLSMKMSIKTVGSFDEALNHINTHSSKHSEAIISENQERIEMFRKMVDASSVYSNTSTAYTDGAQFGLGAEIGISTQKLHARGPMALEELTSYKWIIEGNGQVRPR